MLHIINPHNSMNLKIQSFMATSGPYMYVCMYVCNIRWLGGKNEVIIRKEDNNMCLFM
jgi:hypothetical protein